MIAIRFRNCAAIGDVSLRRYTLIFAENGRGKTTLCAILRSLFTNTPAFIIGRRISMSAWAHHSYNLKASEIPTTPLPSQPLGRLTDCLR
jgi:ABC-type branched-subunit amino acid transport system ATPase component